MDKITHYKVCIPENMKDSSSMKTHIGDVVSFRYVAHSKDGQELLVSVPFVTKLNSYLISIYRLGLQPFPRELADRIPLDAEFPKIILEEVRKAMDEKNAVLEESKDLSYIHDSELFTPDIKNKILDYSSSPATVGSAELDFKEIVAFINSL
jgi:hypothetical protein